MLLAHLSDLHLLSLEGVSAARFLNKRLTGYANLRLKRGHVHRPAYVRAIAREIARRKVDHVIVTGDLTNLALEPEFETAQKVLSEELGLPAASLSIVPGNHDVYTGGAERAQRFARTFADHLRSDLPELVTETPAGPFPFVKLRGPAAIIGLSSAISRPPFVAAGRLGREQLEMLGKILRHDEVARRTPVIALHHPAHNPLSRLKARLEGLDDADELQEILGSLTRGLVIHGHLHRRVRRDLPTAHGSVSVVGATSASLDHENPDRHAGFNLYEIADDGTIANLSACVLERGTSSFRTAEIPG